MPKNYIRFFKSKHHFPKIWRTFLNFLQQSFAFANDISAWHSEDDNIQSLDYNFSMLFLCDDQDVWGFFPFLILFVLFGAKNLKTNLQIYLCICFIIVTGLVVVCHFYENLGTNCYLEIFFMGFFVLLINYYFKICHVSLIHL